MEMQGLRTNSRILRQDNFLYRLSSTRNDSQYYRFCLDTCGGRAVVTLGSEVQITKAHNHEADVRELSRRHVINNMKRRAENEPESLRVIFNEETQRWV